MSKRFPFSKVEVTGALFVALLFLTTSYVSTMYQNVIQTYLETFVVWDVAVVAFYILSTIIATVIAPVSATPLIPIASAAWGPLLAGIYSIIGWTIGAVIAFWIARRFGYEWVGKFVKLKKVQMYAKRIPEKNLFWTIVFMRFILPVDLLSYALGLFSTMSLRSYTLATVIGVTPFAFIFSYTAHLPFWIQVIMLSLIGIMIFFTYKKIRADIHGGDEIKNSTANTGE